MPAKKAVSKPRTAALMDTVDTITARRFDKVLAAPIQNGRSQMARVLIFWHDLLAEPVLDRLHVIDGGLPETEKGAKLLTVATAAAAFQRVVGPGGRKHLKLFGHVIDGRQRDFLVVVGKSAFDLEKTSAARRDPIAPVACAARKAASRRRSGSRTERVHCRSSIVSSVSASERGSEWSRMNYSEDQFGTS